MSGPAYNLANNGGQATLSLAGTRADPGRNKSSPSAAEEIKNCGNVDVEKITLGKISDTVELLEKMQEVNERIMELVVTIPVIGNDGRMHEAALFGQHAWTKELGFEKNFEKNACCATDLLNIASIFYTIETGKTLSFEQAIETMNSAIGKENGIDKDTAWVSRHQKTIDYMTLNLGINTKLAYNEGKGEIAIFALAKKTVDGYDLNKPGHFILCLDSFLGVEKGTNCCFDPDSCRITYWTDDGRCNANKGIEYGIVRPLQVSRDYRGFDIR